MRAPNSGITCGAALIAALLAATNARAEDNEIFVPLGAVAGATVGLVNLAFTAYDVALVARGEAPRKGVALAEVGVMALQLAAIPAVSVALEPRDPLPLFAVSLWPAALFVHGIWALTADRPETVPTTFRSSSLLLTPSIPWTNDWPLAVSLCHSK